MLFKDVRLHVSNIWSKTGGWRKKGCFLPPGTHCHPASWSHLSAYFCPCRGCDRACILLLFFKCGFSLKILFIYFLGGKGGREILSTCKRYINWLPLARPQLGNLARNWGMCSDWELNLWPFGSQARAQSTEPCQPGLAAGASCSSSSFNSREEFIDSWLLLRLHTTEKYLQSSLFPTLQPDSVFSQWFF